MKVSAVVTAAGQNRRMREDLQEKNLPLKNKLLLEIRDKTVLQHTLMSVLNAQVAECLVVVGHYKEEIIPTITEIQDQRIKIVENKPAEVPLAKSLYRGVKAATKQVCICLAGDQPTISTLTLNRMAYKVLGSNNPEKMISIMSRNGSGYLKSAQGLGMPFAACRRLLLNYLPHYASNLNPMLRAMIKDGIEFYGVRALNKLELININYYEDYQHILKELK